MIRKVFFRVVNRALVHQGYLGHIVQRRLLTARQHEVTSGFWQICSSKDIHLYGNVDENPACHTLSRTNYQPWLIFTLPYSTNEKNKQNANFSSHIEAPKETKVPSCDAEKEKKSIFKRFKEMYRDYWYVLVPVHVITSLGWFGGFYYLAKSGVDIVTVVEALGISDYIPESLKDSDAGYFAVAYALYKIATPVRYMITIGGTTVSIKYLKEWGYIKPIPPKAKLKEMYQEKRENLKERGQNFATGIKQKKDKLKERSQTFIRERRQQAPK